MTGDILGITIGTGGWYADITVAGLGIGGTYDFGFGLNNNPYIGTPKITFTITSPGYNDTGTLTTISRTVYGTRQIQKAYPNDASANETVSGSDVILRISLSEYIYSADTVASFSILSGFYTQNSTVNNANTTATLTNSSTVTYDKAKCMLRFASLPFRKLSSTVDVEVAAYQSFGQNNRPVRCVKFIVTDGTNTASQYVTTLTQATTPSGLPKFSLYKCTLSTSTFTQASTLTVQAIAYPWVGDANAVRDTGTTTTTGTSGAHAQAHLCDKDGTYLAPYVYVDTSKNITVSGSLSGTMTDREIITQTSSAATAIVIGTPSGSGPVKVCKVTGTPDSTNIWTGGTSGVTFTPSATPSTNGNTTGVVSTTAATAAATPYSNFWNAVKGIRDYINTNASRANSLNGATIRLMAGDTPFGRDSTVTTMTAPSAAVIIERDPNASQTDVRIRGKGTSTQNILCSNVLIRNLSIWPLSSEQSNYLSTSGLTDECLMIENCIIRQDSNTNGSVYIAAGVEEKYFKDNSHVNTGVQVSGGLVRSAQLSNHNAVGFNMAGLVIGNLWINDSSNTNTNSFSSRSSANTNAILAYNKTTSAGGTFMSAGFDYTDHAIIGNLVERITSGTQPAYGGGDISMINVIFWHNTWTTGSRINLENNTNSSTQFTNLSMRYNSWYYWASKQDVFNSNSALTGGWPTHYGVSCLGNNNTRLVSYPIFGGLLYTTANPEGFTSDNSVKFTSGTGNGNYIPVIGSPLSKRVVSGNAPIDIDIAGTAIPNDGTGDAGAYQQTSNDEPILQSGFFFS